MRHTSVASVSCDIQPSPTSIRYLLTALQLSCATEIPRLYSPTLSQSLLLIQMPWEYSAVWGNAAQMPLLWDCGSIHVRDKIKWTNFITTRQNSKGPAWQTYSQTPRRDTWRCHRGQWHVPECGKTEIIANEHVTTEGGKMSWRMRSQCWGVWCYS